MATTEEGPVKVFISYSRADSAFVDRLEASLRARGFDTWVDRRRLEGGEDWLDEIQHAIDSCQRQVLVLSPAAVESEYVRMEYRYARRIGKPLIPVLLLPCSTVPMDLPMIQWVDFQSDYDDGIKNLMIALLRKTPLLDDDTAQAGRVENSASDALVATPAAPMAQPPETPLRELYTSGLAARARDDLESTAVFWDQILARDPGYLDGAVASEMELIRPRLLPIRLQRLRETADSARRHGEWAQEVAAWQGVLALDPDNSDAHMQLPVAEENQAHAEEYDIARELALKGDQEAARYQLKLLWMRAKYYGDPAGIAPELGMVVPPYYHDAQVQQQRQAQEQDRARALADRKARRPLYRREYLHLSRSAALWCVFGGIAGVGIVAGGFAGNDWGALVAAEFGAIIFAVLSYLLGARRAAHPAAFALMAVFAVTTAVSATLVMWPHLVDTTDVPGYTQALSSPRGSYMLPFFYYTDPFSGHRTYSHAELFAPVYPDADTNAGATYEGDVVQLMNEKTYCGDMNLVGVSGVAAGQCIYTNQPGDPHGFWYYKCAAVANSAPDCSQEHYAGTTTDLSRNALRVLGADGSPFGFALPLALLWGLLGLCVALTRLVVGIVRNGLQEWVPLLLPIASGIAVYALMGFTAGFALGLAIYLLGWPSAGFLCAAVFAFLYAIGFPFEIYLLGTSRRQVVNLLVVSGVLLLASLVLWGVLLGIVSILLVPMTLACVLGVLWGLSMVGTLRMWLIRPSRSAATRRDMLALSGKRHH